MGGHPAGTAAEQQTPLMRLPGLLDDVIGPHQAAHVPGAVVTAGERLESAGDGVGQHQDGGRHPGGRNDLGGVGLGLPHSGRQRVADGAVALQGDRHQVEGGDAHRDACIHQSRGHREVVRLLCLQRLLSQQVAPAKRWRGWVEGMGQWSTLLY